MNLVAKEYCACRIDEDGALILSQFAGAAEQLKTGALLVNPYDVEEVADTVLKAFRMTDSERTARMRRMRRVVREENVFRWVDSFLKVGAKLAARSTGLAKAASARRVPQLNVTTCFDRPYPAAGAQTARDVGRRTGFWCWRRGRRCCRHGCRSWCCVGVAADCAQYLPPLF